MCQMTALFQYHSSDRGRTRGRRDFEDQPDTYCGSYADIVERLLQDYEAQLPLSDIAEVVRQCRRDLAGSPRAAMPELIERLARHRITSMLEAEDDPAQGTVTEG
jgi:hypothetical protein